MLRIVTQSKTRRLRVADQPPRGLDSLPDDWRQLLKRWVRRGGDSRWETLKGDAGVGRQNLAQALLDWLLDNGWIRLSEKFERAEWWPYRVQFQEPAALRAALSIADADATAANWQSLRDALPPDTPLLDALDALPPKTALARADLASALARWQDEQCCGTQRDFALFARGATKAISSAEWAWLGEATDLAEWGIERHTPLLLIAAPVTLQLPQGALDLAACTDFCALTPATLAAATSADGAPTHWQLVENRTSFERVARTCAASAYSTLKRPPIPIQKRHSFQSKSTSDSNPNPPLGRAGYERGLIQPAAVLSFPRVFSLRIDSPFSSMRCDPLTNRSRIASATVGLPPLR